MSVMNAPIEVPGSPVVGRGGSPGLEVRELSVRYGGLHAVNKVSLAAPLGQITGLIGPNGAGKTTTFGACSGLVEPSEGHVLLLADDVTGLSPQARAQRGLGRTFQRMELFESLTVAENIGVGLEAGLAGTRPWNHLYTRRRDVRRIQSTVRQAIERCGLEAVADRISGDLSTGQGRLVELARVIAGGFPMLLLDEPSSGLDKTETLRFGVILRELAAELGRGILLVEHDMSLVLTVCDYVYVLDFGELIFEGTPQQVVASPEVRAAYLGSDTTEATA
jgi:ABC-type branched-subunit amino acid transport system ATPase component